MDTTTLPTEVLIQVAEYLNPADLAHACCVNRTWFIPFASRLWRSIHKDQFAQEALLEALPRYSTFVRELRCSRFARLERLGPECTRLQLVEIPILEARQQGGLALEILERNLDLEEVSVLFLSRVEAARYLMRFIGIVIRMKKLKRLRIDGFTAPQGALDYLLEHLPGLEELTIELWQSNSDAVLDPDFVAWRNKERATDNSSTGNKTEKAVGAEAVATTTQTVAVATAAEGSPSPRELRRLSLVNTVSSFDGFLKLAQNYPLLESIELNGCEDLNLFLPGFSLDLTASCQRLGTYCPRLDQLDLKSVEISDEGLECLLSAFPRLRRLSVENTAMANRDILRILLSYQGYAETVEEITLGQDLLTIRPDSETIEVLRTFRRLRRLCMTHEKVTAAALIQLFSGSNDEQQQQEQPTEASNQETSQGQGQGWRPGQLLEKLEVTIVGPSRDWAPWEYFADEDRADEETDQEEQHGDGGERTYPFFNTLRRMLRENTLVDVDNLTLDYVM
ncbi:hypothetical protein BGX33_005694 [Mortierella sp. NVP41]|nr:hypothetical protein BGX33_005694 [Mortierella sp. NVP41]